MPRRVPRRALLVLPALCALPRAARAAYPDRPIRLINPFAPGGNGDVMARLFGARVSERLGQPVVVENRPGGGGSIGAEAVARARPDGYTLLVGTPGSIVNGPLLQASPRYDSLRDFVAVGVLSRVPMVIMVRPNLPVRTLAGLVDYAKANPGRVTIGTSGIGGANHVPLELFNAATGAGLVHVPYRGGGSTLADFLSGSVDGLLIEFSTLLDIHRDGRGRILAIASTRRSPLAPEVPTFLESGFPGFLAASFVGLFAPAGTPAEIVGAWQDALRAAQAEPAIQERLAALGAEPPTPEELTTPGMTAFLREEFARARRAIELAGLRPE